MADATVDDRTNCTDSNERDGKGVAECMYDTVRAGGNARCWKMDSVRHRCDGGGCNGCRSENERE